MTTSGATSPAQTASFVRGRASSIGVKARIGVSTPLSSTGEVRGGQPAHGLPLVVQDDHVELQQLDAGTELWAFALSLREEHGRRQDAKDCETECAAECAQTHGYSRTLRGI